MKRTLPLFLVMALTAGCFHYRAQSDTGSARQRATQAFQKFGAQLKTELEKAMTEGGPVQAIEVCRLKAPEIAALNSQNEGFEIGRSSHRLRNPANAPDPTVAAYLEKYRNQPGSQAPVEVVESQQHFTVIAPIVMAPLCLTCHGPAESFSPTLRQALASRYPDDQATGFQPGQLRGVFWARIPRYSKS